MDCCDGQVLPIGVVDFNNDRRPNYRIMATLACLCCMPCGWISCYYSLSSDAAGESGETGKARSRGKAACYWALAAYLFATIFLLFLMYWSMIREDGDPDED